MSGSIAIRSAIELSDDRSEYRLHPTVDEVDYTRWELVEHHWRSVDPEPKEVEPSCTMIDESLRDPADVGRETDRMRMFDVFGREFAIVPPSDSELTTMRDDYDAVARTLDPDWIGWRDRPSDSSDGEESAGLVEVCDLGWSRDTYSIPGPNVKDDLWNSDSRVSRQQHDPSLPFLGWPLSDELAVTVSTGTSGAPLGGSGTLVANRFVITNAHVIGTGSAFSFVPDQGPWFVCAWGSNEWCSEVEAFVVSPFYSGSGDHYDDIAVLKLVEHPGYAFQPTDSVQFGLISNATNTFIKSNLMKSAGYPQMVPSTASNPVFNIFFTPIVPTNGFNVLVGDGYVQSGVDVFKTTNRGVKMKMDAMNGQSGSPIYTHNSFNISTVHGLEAGFYNVPFNQGHRGPKIPAHRNFILTAIQTL